MRSFWRYRLRLERCSDNTKLGKLRIQINLGVEPRPRLCLVIGRPKVEESMLSFFDTIPNYSPTKTPIGTVRQPADRRRHDACPRWAEPQSLLLGLGLNFLVGIWRIQKLQKITLPCCLALFIGVCASGLLEVAAEPERKFNVVPPLR